MLNQISLLFHPRFPFPSKIYKLKDHCSLQQVCIMTSIDSDSDSNLSLKEYIQLSLITSSVDDNLTYNPEIAQKIYEKQEEFRVRREKRDLKRNEKKKKKKKNTRNAKYSTKQFNDQVPVIDDPTSPTSTSKTPDIVGVAQALLSMNDDTKTITSSDNATLNNPEPITRKKKVKVHSRKRHLPKRVCRKVVNYKT